MGLINSCKKDEPTYSLAPKNPNQQKLLDLVNKARSKGCNCGDEYYPPVDSVKWNAKLEQAAQKHSNDMNDNNFFSHTGSDGSEHHERILSTGYDCGWTGENIANGYTTEEAVVNGWLKSEGHCKNIMNEHYTEMGVATAGSYWTQDFAAPKNN